MSRQPRPVMAVSKAGQLPGWEVLLHALLIMGTGGLWYPVYLARKHAAARTITTYGPPPPPPQ